VRVLKISTKGRYGVAAMMELALRYNEGLIPLKSISENQNISDKYLEQIFIKLKKAGVIISSRGVEGGYTLKDSPDKIRVGDIIRPLEGSMDPVGCLDSDKACSRRKECVMKSVWGKIKDSIENVIDDITLEDLIKEYSKQKESNIMYHI